VFRVFEGASDVLLGHLGRLMALKPASAKKIVPTNSEISRAPKDGGVNHQDIFYHNQGVRVISDIIRERSGSHLAQYGADLWVGRMHINVNQQPLSSKDIDASDEFYWSRVAVPLTRHVHWD
jgi:hypothetical protein